MATATANRRAAGKAATKTATKRAARPKPTPAADQAAPVKQVSPTAQPIVIDGRGVKACGVSEIIQKIVIPRLEIALTVTEEPKLERNPMVWTARTAVEAAIDFLNTEVLPHIKHDFPNADGYHLPRVGSRVEFVLPTETEVRTGRVLEVSTFAVLVQQDGGQKRFTVPLGDTLCLLTPPVADGDREGEDLKVLTDGHGRKFELQASPAADQVDAREELQELIRRQRPTPHEVLWNTAQRIREEAKDVLIPRLEGALAMMAHVGDSGDELDGDSVFAVKHAIHGAIDRAEQHILEKMNALQELVKQVNESN